MELLTAQLRQGHPLIQRCLHNSPALLTKFWCSQSRLGRCVLEREREECEMTKLELLQTLHSQPGSEVYKINVYVICIE